MQTPFFRYDVDDLPIPCTVCLVQEGVTGMGKVWAFYPASCHVESALEISPGMMVSLTLHLPGRACINLKQGLVTWTWESEFGLRFVHAPATRHQDRTTI